MKENTIEFKIIQRRWHFLIDFTENRILRKYKFLIGKRNVTLYVSFCRSRSTPEETSESRFFSVVLRNKVAQFYRRRSKRKRCRAMESLTTNELNFTFHGPIRRCFAKNRQVLADELDRWIAGAN